MSSIAKTEALVLTAYKWRDSSKIVHLFSADHGYLKVIAKGAFRPRSPFRGVLESLNHVELIFSQKPSRGLQLATGATLLNSFFHIRDDLEKTALGFTVLEIFQELFPQHEPVAEFFQYTVDLLSALNRKEALPVEVFLWHFLLQLSETLGFGWQLERCLKCRREPDTFPLRLDLQNGGYTCRNCAGSEAPQGAWLTRPQWETLQALAAADPAGLPGFDPGPLAQPRPDPAEILLRHLRYHTETPLELKSLKWYM